MSYIIQLEGITKRFPGVTANDHIDINVEKGEIHTLAGENGAGKSTLMNILFGLYRPTEGNIYINGKRVEFQSSKDSIKCGIGMVHQHFMLVPKLTVTENIIAGQEPGKAFVIDRKKATADIKKLSDMYGLRIDPEQKVANLTVTEQQKVEILKVLYRKAEILIFDEPTAALDPLNAAMLEEVLQKMGDEGRTMLISTHDVDFAYRWAERVIVFCHGKIIADDTPLAVFKQEDILKQANLKHPMMFDVYDILKEKGIVPDGDVYPKNIAEFQAMVKGL